MTDSTHLFILNTTFIAVLAGFGAYRTLEIIGWNFMPGYLLSGVVTVMTIHLFHSLIRETKQKGGK